VIQNAINALSLGSLYALFALGVALIFGIMRLVNFAHGELIMVGGFAIVLAAGLPWPVLVLLVVLVVAAFALGMERVAFRPVRGASPATLLVTSFAVSFLLQNLAILIFGSLPRTTSLSTSLLESFTVGDVSIPKLDILTVCVTAALVVALALFLGRSRVGVQMRAAAEDFGMSRLLGVRANTVIAVAFAISGILAAAAALLLVAQTGTVTPTMGLNAVVIAFIAAVVGGMGSLPGAVLGGFVLGGLTVALQASLPLDLRAYRDAFVYLAVFVFLVLRPQGILVPRSAALRSDQAETFSYRLRLRRPVELRIRRFSWRRPSLHSVRAVARPRGLGDGLVALWPLLALMALVVAVAGLTSLGPGSLDRTVVTMLVNLVLVVGLYAFVGTSGVFSFGHMSFMAVGAYTAAIFTIPADTKAVLLPDLPGFLETAHLGTISSLLVAGLVSAAAALVVSLPLMRLSGLSAGLATFTLLIIVNVVAKNWSAVGATSGVTGIPRTTTIWSALVWALLALLVAWLFQRSSAGFRLRASREDDLAARAVGIGVARERRLGFVLSAFVVGIGGGLFGQFIGSFNPDAFFFNITFLTIAMLVVGGIKSLAGAVVGTLVISILTEILRRFEDGVAIGGVDLDAPPGLREVGLAIVMLAILILRPQGLTRGRELPTPAFVRGWARRRAARMDEGSARAPALTGPEAEPK
jgi:branched-subunit amino acid ABC-type transport system permease component